MSQRLDQDKQNEQEPIRMEYAINQLTLLGYTIYYQTNTEIRFMHKDSSVSLFPYSGWFTGKTVKDGRGIANLLKQLKP